MISRNYIISFCLLFLLCWLNPASLSAEEVSNDELIKAATAAAAGNASEKQHAILFSQNKRLNNLAMAGKISAEAYQINQKIFVARNDEIIKKAAGQHGLAVSPSADSDYYKPGTDTDRQIISQKGRLTVDNVKQARGSYNKAVTDYLHSSGLKVSSAENWAEKLSTDIMPSPYDMTPADFKAANSYINSSGGLAYTDAKAARIQLELDSGTLKTPALHEAEIYHHEMQKKIRQMNSELVNLKSRRSGLADPEAIDDLDVEIRKRTAFMSKYIARDNRIAEIISNGRSDSGPAEVLYERTAAGQISRAQKRDASAAALRSEAHVAAVSSHLAEKATRKFNDAIAGASIAADKSEAGRRIVASSLASLSAAQQAQAIADLQIKHGADFAKGVSSELKSLKSSGKPAANNSSISRSLGLVSTAAGIASQYAQGKNTTEIIWNLSIGGTLENVSRSTADYTQKEIEYLKDRYRALGENPDSMAVKLKIMAEASVKGTFYGAAIGSYDLFKSTTSTVAGATAAAADSVIFLVGETLDTRNVLETTHAEIKAQNMEQSVQDARAIKSASEAYKELKRLTEQAEYLRSLLDQNKLAARIFCRNHEHELDILREDLRAINSMDIARSVAELPEKQRKLQKLLTDVAQENTRLTRQAEITAKAFLAAGDQKDVRNVIAALEQAYTRNQIVIEGGREEMVKIGEAASAACVQKTLADFMARCASLQESSHEALKNADLMKQNVSLLKKTVADFSNMRERVLNAESFFAGNRESREAEWMILKNKILALTKPEDKVPEGFFAELGTLERLPDRIGAEIKRLKPAQGIVLENPAAAAATADAALEKLTPLFNQAGHSLILLQDWIQRLKDLLNTPPPVQAAVAGVFQCPSSGYAGENITMKLMVHNPASSGNQPVIKDPFDGHDPNSAHGMLALNEYKRRLKQGASLGNEVAVTIVWDFGDGTTSGRVKSTSISHVYKKAGRYNIRVSAYTADSGATPLFTETRAISISEKTVASDKPRQPATPAMNSTQKKRLPCGHFPGECPTEGIQSLKCKLHQGQISNR